MTNGLRRYRIEINGTQPLLMHASNIQWADDMDRWKADPASKKTSKAGDDRSPAWRWIGALYHDGQQIVMPIDNIMRCLMDAGAMVPIPGGKNGKTFKAQTQSGIMPTSIGWAIEIGGKALPVAPLLALRDEPDFGAHQEAARAAGFELFLKRAKIGKAKHVRVRPRFDRWHCVGELIVVDDQITTPILQTILDHAGRYKGLGDWRPGGKTPGSFGMFEATVKPM